MAKSDEVGFFEQHVEKIVLGVCILAFVVVLYGWVLNSPREIEVVTGMGKETVTPAEVDSRLAEAAKRVWDLYRKARRPEQDIPDYVTLYEGLARDPFPPDIGPMDNYGPPGPRIDRPTTPTRKSVTLAEIEAVTPAPGKPLAAGRWEVARLEPAEDRAACHVVAEYSQRKLEREWNKVLRATTVTPQLVVVAVEAEVQERQSDGTWGPERTVNTVRRATIVDQRTGQPIPAPTIPAFDGSNEQQVQQAIEQLYGTGWQEEILQPAYWELYWPEGHAADLEYWLSWRIHLPETSVSALAEQEVPAAEPREPYRRRPAMPPEREPGRRYRPEVEEDEYIPPDFLKRQRRSGQAAPPHRPTGVVASGRPAYEDEELPPGWRPGQRPPRRPPRRTEPVPRKTATPIVRPPVEQKLPEVPKATPVPSLSAQMAGGTILVWFHDHSLVGGRAYRYRLRLVLLNPLLMRTGDVKKGHEEDARKPTMATPWSPWSDAVRVAQAHRFFVTGAAANLGNVRVSVFSRKLGQRVTSSFNIRPGEPIGGTEELSVVNPITGQVEKKQTDFSTGAVAVELDFGKEVPIRGGAVRAARTKTVEMLYLDAEGRLQSRLRSIDEVSSEYRKLRDEARRTEQAVRRAQQLAAQGLGVPGR
jgi:hypothetical protein